jgi:protein SCO1/2
VKRNFAQWLLVAGLSLAFIGIYLTVRHLHGPVPALPPSGKLPSATLLNDEQPLPAFSFSRSGPALTNADLERHWTIMFFGYTYCPDICPTTLATLKDFKARVVAAGISPPQVVFISVDPARDTPARIASFVSFFDPAFIGATGDDAALAPLAKNLGVHYQRLEGADKDHYVVDHSAGVYLIDPKGRLKALFNWPQDAAAMAQDYPAIIGSGG